MGMSHLPLFGLIRPKMVLFEGIFIFSNRIGTFGGTLASQKKVARESFQERHSFESNTRLLRS